jgi:Ca2+-binding EF-hand superfamily protein
MNSVTMEGASDAKARAENFSHRYSHLCESNTIEEWYRTFCQFDRDGSGDVDLKEVGLMFRQLGQTPTEAEMLAMIEAVDADGSGTIDFEEFCLMMLRMKFRM